VAARIEAEGGALPVKWWLRWWEALNSPLTQVNANRTMLSKINFPKEALVLSGIAQVLFSFMIKLVILALMLIVFQVPVRWTAILLFLPISGLLLLGTLIGGKATIVGPMIGGLVIYAIKEKPSK
jgi:lipopolysaccharide transport system permease protein